MNTRKTSRTSQKGHFVAAFSLALAVNSAVGMAILHTPTEGQRYLAAVASGNQPSLRLAATYCSNRRV